MSSSCKGVMSKFVECLRDNCTKNGDKTLKECIETRPEECEGLRYALFACKRGQLDARSRIQGNKGY